MKAFVYDRYGPPETLRLAEVGQPAPKAGEVLVKVLGASVNAADWHMLRGKPLFSRATLGLLRPKHQTLGVDVAGQVEAVGTAVTLSWTPLRPAGKAVPANVCPATRKRWATPGWSGATGIALPAPSKPVWTMPGAVARVSTTRIGEIRKKLPAEVGGGV